VTTTTTVDRLCIPYCVYGMSSTPCLSDSCAGASTFYQQPTYPRTVYTYRPPAAQPPQRQVVSQYEERLPADVAATSYDRYDHTTTTRAPQSVHDQSHPRTATGANDRLRQQPQSCKLRAIFFYTDHFSGRVEQSVRCVCVCLSLSLCPESGQ